MYVTEQLSSKMINTVSIDAAKQLRSFRPIWMKFHCFSEIKKSVPFLIKKWVEFFQLATFSYQLDQ